MYKILHMIGKALLKSQCIIFVRAKPKLFLKMISKFSDIQKPPHNGDPNNQMKLLKKEINKQMNKSELETNKSSMPQFSKGQQERDKQKESKKEKGNNKVEEDDKPKGENQKGVNKQEKNKQEGNKQMSQSKKQQNKNKQTTKIQQDKNKQTNINKSDINKLLEFMAKESKNNFEFNKKESKKRSRQFWFGIFFIIIGYGLSKWLGDQQKTIGQYAISLSKLFNKRTEERETGFGRLKEIIHKYGGITLQNDEGYVPGLSVQKQLEKLINSIQQYSYRKFPFIVIYGGQGIGKSESLVYITNKMRNKQLDGLSDKEKEQWKIKGRSTKLVYYYSLATKEENNQTKKEVPYIQKSKPQNKNSKNKLENTQQDVNDNFNNLTAHNNYNVKQLKELLEYIAITPKPPKNTYLIVDDVNKLETLSLLQKYSFAKCFHQLQKNGVKIILVSSSTSFRKNFWQKTDIYKIQKRYNQYIVWAGTQSDYDKIIEAKYGLYNEGAKPSKQLTQQIKEQGFSLRETDDLLFELKGKKGSQFEHIFNQYKNNHYIKYLKKMENVINGKFNESLYQDVVQRISEVNAPLSLPNPMPTVDQGFKVCQKIKEQVTIKFKQITNQSGDILRKMDEENVLIFCYPRTQAYRKYCKRYVQQRRKLEQSFMTNKQIKTSATSSGNNKVSEQANKKVKIQVQKQAKQGNKQVKEQENKKVVQQTNNQSK